MTLDMIGGTSYLPKKFIEGLQYWRNHLTDNSATKLDSDSKFTLSTLGDETHGQLIVDKSSSSMTAAYGGIIPIVATQYLEVKFLVRLISGAAPTVRVVGAATSTNGSLLPANLTDGPSTELITGVDMEISAIVGFGARSGVDLAWKNDVAGGYFGLQLTGPNGGSVLVRDMQITDVSAAFLSLHSGLIDIRDYGGIGDGVTDCRAAFLAADAAANGRTLFLPEGDFYVGSLLTLHSPLMCSGRIIADDATPIMLIHQFDLETYIHVFQNEEVAFRKAFQALFKFSDHNILDLRGRRVELTSPVRFKDLLPDITKISRPCIISNGELRAWNSTNWNDNVATSTASYDGAQDSLTLKNVVNIASIDIGAHVYAAGVGREVYVVSKDETAQTLTLNRPLYGAPSSQNYTFTRFKFILDFCEVNEIKYLELTNIRFQGRSTASTVMLAEKGISCKMSHLWVDDPKDRGICSYNGGCNGLTVESCNFQSYEWSIEASQRSTIAVSTRSNDMKIRNNRCTYFRHFAVMGGSGHIISGNHFFQDNPLGGDSRSAGIVTTGNLSKTLFVGNYIDNSWIELSQEHTIGSGTNTFMGYQTITGNIFTLNKLDNAENFSWIKFRPYGTGETLVGVSVVGNTFVNYCDTNVVSAEAVIETDGNFDWTRTSDVTFSGNSWRSVNQHSSSPAYVTVSRSTSAQTWTEDLEQIMPFGSNPLRAISMVANNDLSSFSTPKVATNQGSSGKSISLSFSDSTKGSLVVGICMDK